MLSRRMGEWTRVLVDVEDYRGRRERQLRDIANRAAARVEETGKMLQLEPMPALERRWIHLALRDHPQRRHAVDRRGAEPADRRPAARRLKPRSASRQRHASDVGADAPSTDPRRNVASSMTDDRLSYAR